MMRFSRLLCFVVCLPLTLCALANGERPSANGGIASARTDLHGDPLPPGARLRLGNVRFRNAAAPISVVRFAADGKSVLSIDEKHIARIWETASGKERRHFRIPRGKWDSLTPDFRILVTVEDGESIRLWDTVTGKMLAEMAGKDHPYIKVAFAADGRTLAGLGVDQQKKVIIGLWDLPRGKAIRTLVVASRKDLQEFTPEDLFIAASGKFVAILARYGGDLVYRFWDTATGKELPALGKYSLSEGVPVLSSDCRFLAVVDWNDRQETRLCLLDVAKKKRMHNLNLGHKVEVRGVQFSPDGQTIAVSLEGTIELYSLATGRKTHGLKTSSKTEYGRHSVGIGWPTVHAYPGIAFSPDGKQVAAAADGNLLRLWDVVTGKRIRPVPGGHDESVRALAVTCGGKTVVSISSDRSLRLWDTASGREKQVLPLPRRNKVRGDAVSVSGWQCVAFSSDGKQVAAASHVNTVRLWDLATGRKPHEFTVPGGTVKSLAFTPDSRKLLTGGSSGVFCWEAATGKQIHQLVQADAPDPEPEADETRSPMEVALSPNGRLLAVTRGRDYFEAAFSVCFELQCVELATGKLRWRYPHRKHVRMGFADAPEHFPFEESCPVGDPLVAFAPDGKTLAWNQGEAIEIFDVVHGKPLRQLGGRVDRVTSIAFSPRGDLLAATTADGAVRIWDPATATIRATFRAQRGSLNCLAFHPNGRTLFTGGDDTTILGWDLTGLAASTPSQSRPLAAEQREALWQQLADADAGRAAQAMARLEDGASWSVPFLRDHLQPVPPVEAQRVQRLLAGVEDRRFRVRRQAADELERLAELAEPLLRQRLQENPPLETRRRLEQLLHKLDQFLTAPDQVRALRAIEVLEHIATPDARRLLEALARGAAPARVTRDARAALARLTRRTSARP